MASLLKAFGKGLTYLLALPLLLVGLSFYIVIGIVIFAIIGIKGIILFFSGRNLTELPEDIKAREILEGKSTLEAESIKVEDTKTNETEVKQDYASSYFIPLDTNIPPVTEEPHTDNNEENKEGDNNA
ncbi:MAG: hypothetical protein K5906_01640 [Bacilli bacterium]|nr:hypothetical protein [Bacilli bacterium]